MIVHLCPTFFTEPALFDLIDRFFKYFLTNSISCISIATFHGNISRQCIISIDNHFHIRCHHHGLFYQIHGNVDLSVTIQLITKQIGQHTIIWFKMRKNAKCRSFIYFNACIIRIQFSIPSCCQNKGCHTAIQHIGSGVVTHYFFILCFQRGT